MFLFYRAEVMFKVKKIMAPFASLIIRLFQFIFSAGTVFSLSQQISRNSVLAYFSSEANGPMCRLPKTNVQGLEELYSRFMRIKF